MMTYPLGTGKEKALVSLLIILSIEDNSIDQIRSDDAHHVMDVDYFFLPTAKLLLSSIC
jgi:hypothetical protein